MVGHKEDPVCHHYGDWLELRFHLWPRLDTYIAEQTGTAASWPAHSTLSTQRLQHGATDISAPSQQAFL